MTNLYLFIKAIHIVSFTAWMAGMFYLPRIFVYHSEKKLDVRTYNKFLVRCSGGVLLVHEYKGDRPSAGNIFDEIEGTLNSFKRNSYGFFDI